MKHSSKLRYGPLPFSSIDMSTFLKLHSPTMVGFLDLDDQCFNSFKKKKVL